MTELKARKKKAVKLFHPDEIASAVHLAIKLDFAQAQHVYCLDGSLNAKAFNQQTNVLLKKYCSVDTDNDRLAGECFAKFREINTHMAVVNEDLKYLRSIDDCRIQRSTPRMEKIHKRARALIKHVLGGFRMDEWFTACKHGSGTTLGVPFRDTSVERKFTFPMTVTKEAEPLLNLCLSFDFQLKEAVIDYNSKMAIPRPWYEVVEGSRATTVPKTSDKVRGINIEPTGNMYLQQGLMLLLYNLMKDVGLNVEQLPDRHKVLAKLSSISHENATIDWSSASDCLSVELLRFLLPGKWFDVVMKIRCSRADVDGTMTDLHMVSTMGNAGTFPLETLVFWIYAVAVHQTDTGDTLSLYPEWEEQCACSVFGDDCILPTSNAHAYMECMVSLGFIVNKEKSFYGTEHFRESCGGDYLDGFDTRPFSLKAPPDRKQSTMEPWLYIMANALVEKYKVYFGELSYVYDKELWRTLFAIFRENKINIKLVPSYFPDDSGLKLSSDIVRFKNHYEMKLSPIARSPNGTYSFNFCRYVYRHKVERDDAIMLAQWLKHPVIDRRKSVDEKAYLKYLSNKRRNSKACMPKSSVSTCRIVQIVDVHCGESYSAQGILHKAPERRNGGYVVAKGLSSHWFVPPM